MRVRRASYAERFARPLPWVVSGVGAVAVGGGLGLMLHAQSQYAELAAEPRYQPGLSSPADLAQVDRDALRDQAPRRKFDRRRGGRGFGRGIGLAALFSWR